MKLLFLYINTIRYLKISQIFWRIFYRYYIPTLPKNYSDFKKSNISIKFPLLNNPPSISWSGRAKFLNESHCISDRNIWNDRDIADLWLYNLHYFDDLVLESAISHKEDYKNLVIRWISENPPLDGIGWDPYPTSIRVVNIIKWLWHTNIDQDYIENNLALQCSYLFKKVEWHLGGNHVLTNAKALIFAGIFFDGPEAEKWRIRGISIWNSQVEQQVLSDGAHFELSPMYQSILIKDFLDLIYLIECSEFKLEDSWKTTVLLMLDWLSAMTHSDGEIAYFNDSAKGIALPLNRLMDYASAIGLKVNSVRSNQKEWISPVSGYFRIMRGDALLIGDCAKLGPDYLPGHGHADTLSFEFSVSGRRVFVNTGTSRYGLDSRRLFERSTCAHNTLTINGHSSSETWAGFRVARRAKPSWLHRSVGQFGSVIEGGHNGYLRLGNNNFHKRRWSLRDRALEITDNVTGGKCDAVSRLYLAPGIKPVISKRKNSVLFSNKDHLFELHVSIGTRISISESYYCEEFGLLVNNWCIEMELKDGKCKKLITW